MSQSASFECTIQGRGDFPDVEPDINSVRATLRHSALSNCDITIPDLGSEMREYANFFAPVELRVRITDADGNTVDSERVFEAILTEVESQGQRSEMTLKTTGRGWELDKNESIVEFEDIAVWQAIEKYIEDETDFSVDVVPDPGTPVVTDGLSFEAETQSEWEDLLEDAIPDDVPITVSDGQLTTLPTAFVEEGEESSLSGINVLSGGDEYSDGEAPGVGRDNVEEGDGFDLFMDAPDYDIEDYRLEIRNEMEANFQTEDSGSVDNETIVVEEEDPPREPDTDVICDVSVSVGAGESATVSVEALDDDGNTLLEDETTVSDDDTGSASVDDTVSGFSVLEVSHSGDSTAEFESLVRDEDVLLPGFELKVNGETVSNFGDGANVFAQRVDWGFSRTGQESIKAGETINVTLTVDEADVDFDERDVDGYGVFYWDVVAVVDERFEYDFPNELNEPGGHLNGPQTHPDQVEFEFPVDERETQVSKVRIDSTWDNTDEAQALAASNNNGQDFLSESDTETAEFDFTEAELVGTELVVKTTHGRHSPDGPRDQTPRLGYSGQSIDEIEVRFDQTSLAVIGSEGLLLSDSDLENIKTLADLARFNFSIDHTADEKRIDAYPIGTEGSDVEWDAVDWQRRDGDADYANRVIVRGARKPEDEQEDEDDIRFEAEAVDHDEIERLTDLGLSEDEATVSTVILDPELDTPESVQQQAFNALEGFVESRLPTGKLDVVPTFIPPGFAYPIDEFGAGGDTPIKVLEQLQYSEGYGQSASGTLEFEAVRNWVNAVGPVERDVSGIKRIF